MIVIIDTQDPTPPTFITKKCCPKFSPVWSHFTLYAKKAGGHYSGACNFCEFKISTATVSSLKERLANVCKNVPEAVKLEYLKKRAGDIKEPVSVVALDKK
ncbi:9921_t:CDS:2 [Funneliformis geosporum]|nr:9921_t:CDS:2 [Funneliformis geosporum]